MIITCGIYLFNNQNKLLIGHPTNHKWTMWTVPKGRVDEGETHHFSVAKRELWEEANINLDQFRDKVTKVTEFDLVRYKATNKYLKGFLVKVNHGFDNHDIKCDSMVMRNGKPAFPEIDAFKWVTIEEAKTLLHESQLLNLDLCQDLI
jgi:8-oxo-dGTP pyrophosphatase MutT (NUDIX family)